MQTVVRSMFDIPLDVFTLLQETYGLHAYRDLTDKYYTKFFIDKVSMQNEIYLIALINSTTSIYGSSRYKSELKIIPYGWFEKEYETVNPYKGNWDCAIYELRAGGSFEENEPLHELSSAVNSQRMHPMNPTQPKFRVCDEIDRLFTGLVESGEYQDSVLFSINTSIF